MQCLCRAFVAVETSVTACAAMSLTAGRELPQPGAATRHALALHLTLIGNHLTCHDVDVERHRFVPGVADLHVMTPGRDAKRLRSRRELSHRADIVAVD